MKSKNYIAFLAICTATALLSACSGQNDGSEGRLKVNQKYVLKSWPDSTYIAELDSILKAEPLKANADSERTELTIYSGSIPTISLPDQKKPVKQTSAAGQQASAKQTKAASPAKSAELFADNFMNALNAMLSDPTSSAKYRTVTAKSGEDLFALLSRAYGHDATKLPRFYTLSTLQSMNPDVKLEHLNGGDNVRIPKL